MYKTCLADKNSTKRFHKLPKSLSKAYKNQEIYKVVSLEAGKLLWKFLKFEGKIGENFSLRITFSPKFSLFNGQVLEVRFVHTPHSPTLPSFLYFSVYSKSWGKIIFGDFFSKVTFFSNFGDFCPKHWNSANFTASDGKMA